MCNTAQDFNCFEQPTKTIDSDRSLEKIWTIEKNLLHLFVLGACSDDDHRPDHRHQHSHRSWMEFPIRKVYTIKKLNVKCIFLIALYIDLLDCSDCCFILSVISSFVSLLFIGKHLFSAESVMCWGCLGVQCALCGWPSCKQGNYKNLF